MADDYICQDCEKEGNSADFIDGICDECDGEVVSLDVMEEIKAQKKEVTTPSPALASMGAKLMSEEDF